MEALVLVLTEWVNHANCRDYPVSMFVFDNQDRDSYHKIIEAKAICAECTVKTECLAEAIKTDSIGIWGGLTRKERKRIPIVEKIVPIPAIPLEYRDGKYRQIERNSDGPRRRTI